MLPGARLLRTRSSQASLATHATLGPDGRLRLVVVNKDPARAHRARITVQGFEPTKKPAALSVYGLAEEARDGAPSESTFPASGSVFDASFDAYSSTLITLSR